MSDPRVKALIQRASKGSVTIDGTMTGSISRGYVVLLGVREGDTENDARHLAAKTANLRVFPDEKQLMNLSIQDIGGSILVISQFTLYADTRKGNRPSFNKSGNPETASHLYEVYIQALKEIIGNDKVASGLFGAMMTVEIVNEGPVTIDLNTDALGQKPEVKVRGTAIDNA